MIPRPTWLSAIRNLLHQIRARIVLCCHCVGVLCFALCLLFTVTWPAWLLLVVCWCAYWAQVQK